MEKLKEMLSKYGLTGTILIILGALLITFVTACSHFHLKATDLEVQNKIPLKQEIVEESKKND